MESATTLIGSRENPVASDHMVLMRFLCEKGRQGRRAFESIPIYLGEDIW